MEEKSEESQSDLGYGGTNIIPNKLHAVWLGKMLDKEGRKNIIDWKKKNMAYKVNLWIDSSTYNKEDRPAFISLLNWAEENRISICDINPKPKSKIARACYVNRADIYEKMIFREYYDDEITGQYPNYAAASDMLRACILYIDGGIYFDARDVNPQKPLPKEFRLLASLR